MDSETPSDVNKTDFRPSLGQSLHKFIQERLPFVKRLDAYPFVSSMETDVIPVHEDALNTISRDTSHAKVFSVGCTHDHGWHHQHTAPKSIPHLADGLQYIGPYR